jgi:tripartite-type tricarboxylate transporter receptor subunit TctC
MDMGVDLNSSVRAVLAVGFVVTLLMLPASLAAQERYPVRPVTLVSPQSPGTTMDVLARLYAEKLSARLGASFVVSNRPGAGGLIAAQAVAGAQPDGYTLAVANSGHAILGVLNKNLPFDPIRDFAGISMIGETPALVVVVPTLGVRTLKEFVDLAKAKPGAINYSSAGIGSATHIAGAYFAYQAGIKMVHIPYRSGSEGIADMLAGRVESVFAPAAFTLPMLRDGKLLALAVSASAPLREPIEVPSARSANIDYEYSTWYGFLAPAKTPASVVEALSRAISEISQDPEFKAKLLAQGITPNVKPLAAFDAHIKDDMDRLRPVLDTIATTEKN